MIPADLRSMKLAAQDWSMTCGGSGAESSGTKNSWAGWFHMQMQLGISCFFYFIYLSLPLCWVCTDYQLQVLCWSSAHALLARGDELHFLFFFFQQNGLRFHAVSSSITPDQTIAKRRTFKLHDFEQNLAAFALMMGSTSQSVEHRQIWPPYAPGNPSTWPRAPCPNVIRCKRDYSIQTEVSLRTQAVRVRPFLEQRHLPSRQVKIINKGTAIGLV